MMRYEKALMMQISYVIMAEEQPSESRNEETISVKEILDYAKIQYEKRQKVLNSILDKIKAKIKFAKKIVIVTNDSFILNFEEPYDGEDMGRQVDNYDGIDYELVVEKGKIKLDILLDDIIKVQRFHRGEVYFENGVLERVYNGGKTWIRKMLSEIKEEITEIDDYIEGCSFAQHFNINTISNSFEINLLPEYFSITDMTGELIRLYKSPKNFEIDYFFSQEPVEESKNKYTKISTFEGEFLVFNASRQIKKWLDYRTRTDEEDVDLLLEFIKNLRVYKSEVPEYLLE